MTAEVVSIHSPSADARPSLYGYGFGVGITPAGRTTISHSGAFALGAGTYYAIIPSAGIGIVVLTNAEPGGAAEEVGTSFTDIVQFGMVTRDWFAAYGAAMTQLTAPAGDLVGKSPLTAPAPAARSSSYVGRYGNPYFGDAEIVDANGHLELKISHLSHPMY